MKFRPDAVLGAVKQQVVWRRRQVAEMSGELVWHTAPRSVLPQYPRSDSPPHSVPVTALNPLPPPPTTPFQSVWHR